MTQWDLVLNSVFVCTHRRSSIGGVWLCRFGHVLLYFTLFFVICLYSAEGSKGSRKQAGGGRLLDIKLTFLPVRRLGLTLIFLGRFQIRKPKLTCKRKHQSVFSNLNI